MFQVLLGDWSTTRRSWNSSGRRSAETNGVAVLVEDEVAVDLVGDQDQVVACAEVGEAFEFGRGEDAAERVLRVAEDEDAAAGVTACLEAVPVEGPAAGLVADSAGHA